MSRGAFGRGGMVSAAASTGSQWALACSGLQGPWLRRGLICAS
jgi:hypothetical protein